MSGRGRQDNRPQSAPLLGHHSVGLVFSSEAKEVKLPDLPPWVMASGLGGARQILSNDNINKSRSSLLSPGSPNTSKGALTFSGRSPTPPVRPSSAPSTKKEAVKAKETVNNVEVHNLKNFQKLLDRFIKDNQFINSYNNSDNKFKDLVNLYIDTMFTVESYLQKLSLNSLVIFIQMLRAINLSENKRIEQIFLVLFKKLSEELQELSLKKGAISLGAAELTYLMTYFLNIKKKDNDKINILIDAVKYAPLTAQSFRDIINNHQDLKPKQKEEFIVRLSPAPMPSQTPSTSSIRPTSSQGNKGGGTNTK